MCQSQRPDNVARADVREVCAPRFSVCTDQCGLREVLHSVTILGVITSLLGDLGEVLSGRHRKPV